MKKTLTAALTTALVVGAASTTFAAANPFSDVPMDHWAYDAVAQLADDGIIEGYGDGSYRGQNEITRYEMAQMVAKAMAKEDQVNARQKAMIDRLAAKFSEELNNLGVRVANLESRIDNVKWTGELRYTYSNENHDEWADKNTNRLRFRIHPQATVNDHWKVKARLEANTRAEEDSGATVQLKQAYAMGHYGITDINAGLMPIYTEQGVVLDDNITGVAVTVGKGQNFSGTLTAGRINMDDTAVNWKGATPINVDTESAALLGLNLNWKPTDKLTFVGEYYRLTAHNGFVKHGSSDTGTVQNIWGLGATYMFDENVSMNGGYWKNQNFNDSKIAHTVPETSDHAWNVQLNYKGAQKENARSFGLYAAYRYLGHGASLAPTFDGAKWGQKGWEVGGNYTFAKNVVGTLVYFNGKDIELTTNDKVSTFFGQLQYFF